MFVVLCGSLYRQVVKQDDLAGRWAQIRSCWEHPYFWLVILLMLVNWSLEARKWQILLEPLQQLNLWQSIKSVLAGCSITMLTPNRMGEYGGRILFIDEEKRLRAISLNVIGSISQLLVTFIMGTIGLILLQFYSLDETGAFNMLPEIFSRTLLAISVLICLAILSTYFLLPQLVHRLKKFGFLSKFLRHIAVIQGVERKQLLRIFILSFIRYMVFILQYQLLLYVMNVTVNPILSFWLLSVFYLVMALAPTIGFTELPVRATASVELFALYSNNILGIQAAALAIWIINLVLPAVMGSFLILGIKMNRK